MWMWNLRKTIHESWEMNHLAIHCSVNGGEGIEWRTEANDE